MEKINTFQTTPRIISGPGALSRIGNEINRLSCKKVIIITDTGPG